MRIDKYIWDDVKNRINIKKHNIDFKTATKVFDDENRIIIYDSIHSVYEDRYFAIGSVDSKITILTVVFTDRHGLIRIISARKATKKERGVYYDSFC